MTDQTDSSLFQKGWTMKIKAAFAAAAMALAPAAASATSYDIVTGGPQFSYGIGTGGTSFSAFSTFSVACFGQPGLVCVNNGNSNAPPVAAQNISASTIFFQTVAVPSGALLLHPGDADDLDAIIRFTADVAGTYTVGGLFSRLDVTSSGTGTFDSIFHNGASIFSGTLPASGTSLAFNTSVVLGVGDTLDFVVNRNGTPATSYYYDSTGIAGTLTTGAIPEPATWGLMILGFGAVGAALRLRKRVSTEAIA